MKSAIILTLILLITTIQARAEEDAIIKDSHRCIRYFSYYEQKYQIPSHLLKSVSMIESGLWHNNTQKVVPWPWTINYKGKGYFFKDKQSAIEAVRKILDHGDRSVDVGCMQINLLHHKNAFKSLEHAFDPRSNIEYGAKFLKTNFERTSSWRNAVAVYHSEKREHGIPYSHRVLGTWKKETLSTYALNTSTQKNKYYNRRANVLGDLNNRFNPNERNRKSMYIQVKKDQNGEVKNTSSASSNTKDRSFR